MTKALGKHGDNLHKGIDYVHIVRYNVRMKNVHNARNALCTYQEVIPLTPTLQDLKTLSQRKELLYLLRECESLPDSALTALGYLLWTIQQEKKATNP